MKYWEVLLNLTWPHERVAIGWDILPPDEENEFYTAKIYLTILTVYIYWN